MLLYFYIGIMRWILKTFYLGQAFGLMCKVPVKMLVSLIKVPHSDFISNFSQESTLGISRDGSSNWSSAIHMGKLD